VTVDISAAFLSHLNIRQSIVTSSGIGVNVRGPNI